MTQIGKVDFVPLFGGAPLRRAQCRSAQDDTGFTDRLDYAIFHEHCGVVDASERIEVDAALRIVRITSDDRLGADDQRRQSSPSASAVSMASS